MNLPRRFLFSLCSVALLLSATANAADYRLDAAKSSLSFAFNQAGGINKGKFGKFDVKLSLTPEQLATSKLDVLVQVGSLDTDDDERDQILKGAELFDVAKHPDAKFTSASITRTGADRYEAAGKLIIRGVARDVRIPFTFKAGAMSGELVIKRLDFGVGQGEWKSTEWVANEVTISFALRLTQATAATS
jgi:polyisoprenoid-binding protein YceI